MPPNKRERLKTRKHPPYLNQPARVSLKTPAAVMCALALAVSAIAQQVLVPPPAIPPEQPPPPEQNTNEVGRMESAAAAPAATAGALQNQQPFQWGQITFHPHLAYQFLYGNGIQSQPGRQQKTIIQDISPGLGFDMGDHWKLDYTPTAVIYSDKNFRNTVDHAIGLTGGTDYEDWTFGLSQNVALSSDPQVQTAAQTDQQTYETALSASYRFNGATSLELGISQDFRFVQGITNALSSSRDWATMDWLNYQWGPNIGTAGGVGFGYTAVDVGSDMTYEQLQGRLTLGVTSKINLSLAGGAEIRQFLDTSAPNLVNPIFEATLRYQPVEVTTLSLGATRTTSSSYYQNQVTDNTTLSASVRQRFLGRFYLGLSGGYTKTTYQASAPGVSVNSELNYHYFRADLSTGFLKRGTASVFYSMSRNSSSQAGFGYSSDQVGFSLAYSY